MLTHYSLLVCGRICFSLPMFSKFSSLTNLQSCPAISFLIARDPGRTASPMTGTEFAVGDKFIPTVTKTGLPIGSPEHSGPRWITPWATDLADYWVWLTNTEAFRWDGSQHTNITPASGSMGGADTAPYTGGILGDVLIVNNENNVPHYFLPASGTVLSPFTAALPSASPTGMGWDANLRCHAL